MLQLWKRFALFACVAMSLGGCDSAKSLVEHWTGDKGDAQDVVPAEENGALAAEGNTSGDRGTISNTDTLDAGPAALPGGSSQDMAAQPSFDCAKAASATEQAICANPMLAEADRELASLYRQVSGQRSRQRAFLRRRNACGGNDGCIGQAYVDRIAELRRLAGGAGSASSSEYDVRPALDFDRQAQQAAGNPDSCLAEKGRRVAENLVRLCTNVSPATRPPCNMANSCDLIVAEIRRGCEYVGPDDAPDGCHTTVD